MEIYYKRAYSLIFIKMVKLQIALFVISLASAEWFWGRCPNPSAMPEFRFSDYTGNWYEVMSTQGGVGKWNDWSCPRSVYTKED